MNINMKRSQAWLMISHSIPIHIPLKSHYYPYSAIEKVGSNYNGGKTTINHPPVITIFIGGIFTIPGHGWFVLVYGIV